jgi:hypothetical protein
VPVIYEAKCSKCAYRFGGLAGYQAVIVDQPDDSSLAHPEEPRLVILAHPGESHILARCGFTYQTAARDGRLVAVKNVACSDCGTRYELRRVDANSVQLLGDAGCAGIAVAQLAVLTIAAIIGWQSGWYLTGFFLAAIGLCAVCGMLFQVADARASRFVRSRHPDRVREFDRGPGCPRCHSLEYTRLSTRAGKLRCPECQQYTVEIKAVAKS